MKKRSKLLAFVSVLVIALAVVMNTIPSGTQTADYNPGSINGESSVLTPFFQSVTERADTEGWEVSYSECAAVPDQVRYVRTGYPFAVKERVEFIPCGPIYEKPIDLKSLGMTSLAVLLAGASLGFMIYSGQRFIRKRT